ERVEGRASYMARSRLVVLRHNSRRGLLAWKGVAQQGHRGKRLAMPTTRRRRRVGMESGTCRSGRSGRAPRAPSFGNCKRRDIPGATRFAGGKSAPLRDEEAVGGDAHRGVVVEADPSSALEVAEPDLLFELLVIWLDAPAH